MSNLSPLITPMDQLFSSAAEKKDTDGLLSKYFCMSFLSLYAHCPSQQAFVTLHNDYCYFQLEATEHVANRKLDSLAIEQQCTSRFRRAILLFCLAANSCLAISLESFPSIMPYCKAVISEASRT